MKSALVLGKFLPPTKGHQFLIDFARSYRVDGEQVQLTVMVATLPNEGVPGHLRFEWIRDHYERFPNVRVVFTNEVVPQDPSEHPDFWAIWTDLIARVAGENFDYVFASEHYGKPLAEHIGATFVPVDIARTIVPISGTKVRETPAIHFDQMMVEAQRHFAKRIVFFGAESVGKTTMAAKMAQRFNTRWLPEWARGYLNVAGVDVTMDKIEEIARGQMAMEDAAMELPLPFIIQDTDLVATVAWSEILLGSAPEWVKIEAQKRRANIYIILDTNVKFVEDAQRYGGNERQMTTDQAVSYLDSINGSYVIVEGGTYEDREEIVASVIAQMSEGWFKSIPQWK